MSSGGGRLATLVDVAAHAGVSRATASRVLNGSTRNVGPELRQRVSSAAAELGYVANTAAQSVVRGRSQVIGFLIGSFPDDYFNPIALGVLRAAQRRGEMVTMTSLEDDLHQAVRIVSAFRAQRARLLIVSGSRTVHTEAYERLDAELAAFAHEGGQVVTIGHVDLPFASVRVDDHEVGRLMVQRYLELGYREITIFAGDRELLTSRLRTEGALAALKDAGLDAPLDRVVHSPFTRDGGYIAAGEFVRRGMPTQAILCVADSLALGAMARLRESGVNIGKDIALSGVDDLAALRDVTPSLTTVKLPWEEIGAHALSLGLDEHPGDLPLITRYSGHVIVRETTPRR